MLKPNGNYANLKDSYLFFGISKKVAAYKAEHPDLPLYRLGIGDVSRPLCDAAIQALHAAVQALLRGTLPEISDATCDHHEHHHEGGCGSHGCHD